MNIPCLAPAQTFAFKKLLHWLKQKKQIIAMVQGMFQRTITRILLGTWESKGRSSLSLVPFFDPVHAPMSKLRRYQDALARAAREPGNHVVVLPTGAGKTLISFDLIFTALLRHPRKIVVFLAPTILLVNQQHQEFLQEAQKRGLSLETGLLAGGKRHNLGRCHVLFATPAASEQVCSTDELKSVSLLVMDEVHHAQAKKAVNWGQGKDKALELVVTTHVLYIECLSISFSFGTKLFRLAR